MLHPKVYRFFWDVDPSHLESAIHATFVIERLLDKGDLWALGWLRKTFSQEQIIRVIKNTRSLSPRSARFWVLYFNLDSKDVRCMQKPWRNPLPNA